jgi:uncharacterized membrane-anchored protein
MDYGAIQLKSRMMASTSAAHSPQQSLPPGNPIWITLRIEAYFVRQGTGSDIESAAEPGPVCGSA